MPHFKYNPATAVPDLSGKVILITGGTAGLGKESILHLAVHNPAHIYFTGRSTARADDTIAAAKAAAPNTPVTFIQADLGSLASVADAAKQLLAAEQHLDVVIANAGIMAVPAAVTTDGYEVQFGTNHVAHALLLKLLLPMLQRTAGAGHDVRIVTLSSLGYELHPKGGILFDTLRSTQESKIGGPWTRYGQSKLANILYSAELARRYPNITSVSIHPGVVGTELVTGLPLAKKWIVYVTNPFGLMTPAQGAYTQVWAATAKKEGIENGAFYEPVGKPGKRNATSKNTELAAQLWDWTQKELEGYEA